jgi:hypothetical protein
MKSHAWYTVYFFVLERQAWIVGRNKYKYFIFLREFFDKTKVCTRGMLLYMATLFTLRTVKAIPFLFASGIPMQKNLQGMCCILSVS